MSFLDCINTAVETGRLSQNKADQAAEEYAATRERMLKADVAPNAADYGAAHEALKEIDIRVTEKRIQRIAAMKKEKVIFDKITGAKSTTNVLASRLNSTRYDSLMDLVELTQESVAKQLAAHAALLIKKYDARFLGLHQPIENMDNVAYSAFDVHRDPAAEPLGLQIKETYALIRKMENLEGAHIPDVANYGLHMQWDRFLVGGVSEDQYVAKVLALGEGIDWKNMRYAGKAIKDENKESMLRMVYNSIISEGKNKVTPAFADNENTASNLSRRRFILFKTPDAWLAMNKEFGKGNMYQQFLADLNSASRNIALMRVLGPSPAHGKAFAERTLEKRWADDTKSMTVKDREKARVDKNNELKAFQDQYDILSHNIEYGEGNPMTQVLGTARSIAGTALLGNVGILSLSDIAYGAAFRNFYKMPVITLMPRYFHAMLTFGKFKQQMITNAMFKLSNLTTNIHDSQRYTMGLEGGRIANKLSDFNYRATLAQPITEVGQGLVQNDFAEQLARYADKPLDQVPIAELLRNLDITDEDWNVVRGNTPIAEPEVWHGMRLFGKGQFLYPRDMYTHAINDLHREAANKFLMASELISRGGSPSSSVGSRALTGGSVSPAAAYGQFLKSSAQFMAFPAGIMYNQWKFALSVPGAVNKIKRASILIAYTTAAGAMVQQLKALASGQDMLDMDPRTNPNFWLKSMVVGGAGGILGDFVWNNLATVNHPSTMPVVDAGKKAWAAFAEPVKAIKQWAFDEEYTAKPARAELEAVWGLMPKPAPYKLAMERMLYDPMLEYADPAAFQKKLDKQQANEMNTGQGTWWGAGEQPH